MTPAARVAAAIEILDDILDGAAPEKAVTGWGRAHRFAGSKDRAAIRDHVFQALRCRASYAWLGGAGTGRGIMLGAMRAAGSVDEVFSGVGHAPSPTTADEIGADPATAPRAVRLDIPDWLLPHFDAAFGSKSDGVLTLMQARAGVFLRVNLGRTTLEDAQAALASDDIACIPVSGVRTALQVVENERRINNSSAYASGLVELQDPSSQAAILALPNLTNMGVLDYCAGGGGKALAMAALGAKVSAHDVDPRRMTDIAPRAARAGVEISTLATDELDSAAFDLVFCDAPCSGSGTWRRAPAAKWDLTPDRLQHLTDMQDQVLQNAARLVRPGGHLVYATCSVFDCENAARVQKFLDQAKGFSVQLSEAIAPHTQGDGFYFAQLRRDQ